MCQDIARATLEGHQRAIMGAMTVDEIFKDRKKFSEQVFDVASTDLVNMGFQVYTDKKENKIFLKYKEIQKGAVAKSCMTNGLLIYD
jgi:hypothetical protein